ncbi:MAG: FecR domain-containing protein [Niabella sp.]
MPERLVILLSRKLAGEATAAELAELEHYIKENQQEHYIIEVLEAYWQSHSTSEVFSLTDDNARFNKLLDKAQIPEAGDPAAANDTGTFSGYRPGRKWMAIAAALTGLILLGGLVLFQYRHQLPADKQNTIVTARGAKSYLLLPDGSKIWLNADSRLNYDKKFDQPVREVYLEGEAYFDVAKNSRRPFIVHTSLIDIKVLGTAFNVNAYKKDSLVEAVLVHGLIEITNKNEPEVRRIILHPSQKYQYINRNTLPAGGSSTKPVYTIQPVVIDKTDSTTMETAWVNNRLEFDGDTFTQLSEKLERWFNVEIVIKDREVAKYRLRGVFEDENISQVLTALQSIASFKYSINGNKIEITK